jgi:hypothetical protein
MKANLEFNLPEESEAFRTAINGWKYKLILSYLNEHLRSKIKWEEMSDETMNALQDIRNEIFSRLSEDNLTLEEE